MSIVNEFLLTFPRMVIIFMGMASAFPPGMVARLQNFEPFYRLLLSDLGEQVLLVLQEHTPGTRLPFEWTAGVKTTRDSAELTIWHTRLEGNRQEWLVVFHSLNSGSVAHYVAPVNAQALSWVEGGTRFFSKGHFVSGIVPSYFAEFADRAILDFVPTIERKFASWIETGQYA